jgi:hypothetical protein
VYDEEERSKIIGRILGLFGVISSNNDPLPKVTPLQFRLEQNYPNPFNPTTVIGYRLSAISNVKLSIYDLRGKPVAILVKDRQNAGYHQVEWDASRFASGLYYYRIQAGGFVQVKKMVLIR